MRELDGAEAEYVTRGFYIPPRPEILSDVQSLAAEDSPNLNRIGQRIADDVGLTAAILKTVNSPFYGIAKRVADIGQAAKLLGVSSIVALVASHAIRRAMTRKASISLERFWDTATEVANAMVYVAHHIGCRVPPEEMYLAGLFHDCGIAALAMKFADYKETLIEANESLSSSLVELENERYRTDHAVVGYFIASSWGLPHPLCETILQHHEDDALSGNVDETFGTLYSVLKVAENAVERTRRFHPIQEWIWVKEPALEFLGITGLDYSDIEENVSELLA